jgi:hypothetical protein
MRKLAALALLFSAQAFACPNLAGTYTCTYQDNSSEQVVISQELKDGVTVYTHNGSQIPADNVAYPVPDDASLHDATFRAWCADDLTLSANLVGKYWQDGQYFGDLNMTSNFTLSGTDLKQVTTGTLKNQGGEYPLNSDMTCVRNP